jgi:hypothetical protein
MLEFRRDEASSMIGLIKTERTRDAELEVRADIELSYLRSVLQTPGLSDTPMQCNSQGATKILYNTPDKQNTFNSTMVQLKGSTASLTLILILTRRVGWMHHLASSVLTPSAASLSGTIQK